jgi:hypothetical protein
VSGVSTGTFLDLKKERKKMGKKKEKMMLHHTSKEYL